MFSFPCPSYLTTFSLYQSIVPRHTLDVCMKYSHVPQTEAPYKLDRAEQEIDWAEEPQKVSIVVTNYLPGVLQQLVHHNTISITTHQYCLTLPKFNLTLLDLISCAATQYVLLCVCL